MTSLADVALAFCNECLGWEDARILNGTQTVFEGHGGGRLTYHDLNAVMTSIRGWCDEHDMTIFQRISGNEIGTSIQWSGHARLPEPGTFFWATEPCQALLTACVEAARKLKAAA